MENSGPRMLTGIWGSGPRMVMTIWGSENEE